MGFTRSENFWFNWYRRGTSAGLFRFLFPFTKFSSEKTLVVEVAALLFSFGCSSLTCIDFNVGRFIPLLSQRTEASWEMATSNEQMNGLQRSMERVQK